MAATVDVGRDVDGYVDAGRDVDVDEAVDVYGYSDVLMDVDGDRDVDGTAKGGPWFDQGNSAPGSRAISCSTRGSA